MGLIRVTDVRVQRPTASYSPLPPGVSLTKHPSSVLLLTPSSLHQAVINNHLWWQLRLSQLISESPTTAQKPDQLPILLPLPCPAPSPLTTHNQAVPTVQRSPSACCPKLCKNPRKIVLATNSWSTHKITANHVKYSEVLLQNWEMKRSDKWKPQISEIKLAQRDLQITEKFWKFRIKDQILYNYCAAMKISVNHD